MPNFRQVANGYVNASVDDGTLSTICRGLAAIRKDALVDFALIYEGYTSVDILQYAKTMTGNAFDEFLKANYADGRGPLSSLIRCIVHYLNDKCGHQSVLTAISIEENKLKADRLPDYLPKSVVGSKEPFLKDGYTLADYDLYRLMSGIGPTHLGRFLLLIGGRDYYV